MKAGATRKQTRAIKAVYFAILLFFFMFLFSAAAEALYYAYLLSTGMPQQVAYSLLASNGSMLEYVLTVATSFSFSAAAIAYLRFFDRSRKGIAQRLGLGLAKLRPMNIGLGLLLFGIVIALEILISVIGGITNVSIQTNVNALLAGAPIWFLVFTVLVAPINEEILFRGLMVPRIGIVASAVLFALPHITYDSTFAVEVIAALVFGILAGYIYKKTGSLYASITAHMLVNALPVLALVAMLGV